MARAAAVMVCGTTSAAGKSFLATALARCYARRGIRVAPFKAQNMSNNARAVEGGEIGSAQYFQALAARCVPEVRFNPVLLKPECDSRSQVVLLGRRADRLSEMPWRERAHELWPIVHGCLEDLLESYEVVVIEGAGSPAEINLHSSDIVNMRVARAASAATLLVADIDRGGAFAHLYGTHQLLPPEERALLRGFVLNKFRGDVELLAPGPERLEQLTGVPTLGVLPLWREHGLPEEDGVYFEALPGAAGAGPRLAIVSYPRISNLDEFSALRRIPGAHLVWAHTPQALADADVLILPGSKHVAADLEWLRARGMARAITAHVRAGRPTLAICGGLQMLGLEILDPHGVEGASHGLALLPCATEYAPAKQCRFGHYRFGELHAPWSALSGIAFQGYEIRHGQSVMAAYRAPDDAGSTAGAGDGAAGGLRAVLPNDAGWQCGPVLALYTHGMFENSAVLRALFGANAPTLDDTLEGLADFIEAHIPIERLLGLLVARRGSATARAPS